MVFESLLSVILNLIVTGINVTIFFLVIRAVMLWKNVRFLKGFDDAGTSLVNACTKIVGRLWGRLTHKHLTFKANLLIGLIMLELSKMMVVGLVRLL